VILKIAVRKPAQNRLRSPDAVNRSRFLAAPVAVLVAVGLANSGETWRG